MSLIDEIRKAPEDQKELNRIDFRLEVSIALSKAMSEERLSQSDLARILGVSRGRVSQVLHGNSNITIDTLADYSLALGRNIKIEIVPDAVQTTFQEVAANWDRPTPVTRRAPRRERKVISLMQKLEKKETDTLVSGDQQRNHICGAGHAS